MLKAFIGTFVGKAILLGIIALLLTGVTYHFYTLGVQRALVTKVTKERDASDIWIFNVCSSVATPPQSRPELYRPACMETIRRLFSFYTQANSETTKALVQAEQDRVRRLEEDNRVKAEKEQALKIQLRRLKEISVNVKDDQVGPDYWAAVNRVAGLRALAPEAGRVDPGHNGDSSGHVDSAAAPDRIADLLEASSGVPGN